MLFRPKNSIIVSFDYQNPDSFNEFQEQINAIQEHYRFSRLSDLLEGKRLGKAFVVFENPRKGGLLRGVQVVLSQEIPFTLFVDPDYVGLNRLPLEEEIEIYQKAYPERWNPDEVLLWKQRASKNPQEVDYFLKQCRVELGPLPVEQLDPLRFFSTWGKLAEWPKELVEFGISLRHEISFESLHQKIRFFEWQLKCRPKVARLMKETVSKDEIHLLKEFGIQMLVGHQKGQINPSTSLWELPLWSLT